MGGKKKQGEGGKKQNDDGAQSIGGGGQEEKYTLNIDDMASEKINKVNEAASQFQETMSMVNKTLKNFHVPEAITSVIDFVKSTTEEFRKLDAANSQVQASLQKRGNAASLSLGEVQQAAQQLSGHVKNSRAEITGMMATLLTYPGVTKANFEQASEASVDMATKLNINVGTAAAKVGEALKDPAKAMQNLNKLTQQYGGTAAAAFNTSGIVQYQKAMQTFKTGFGEIVTTLSTALAPAFTYAGQKFNEYLQPAFDWIRTHHDEVKAAVVMMGTSILVVLAPAIWSAVTATWSFTTALLANPLGLVIGGAIILIYKFSQKFAAVRGVVMAVWGVFKAYIDFLKEEFTGVYHIIHGIFNALLHWDFSELKQGVKQIVGGAIHAIPNMFKGAVKGYQEGVDDFKKEKEDKATENAGPKPAATGAGAAPDGTDAGPTGASALTNNTGNGKLPKAPTVPALPGSSNPAPAATGNKVTNVIINIGKLIEKFEIRTTNITDSAGKIEELVANALLKATNDASLYTET